MGAVAKTSRQLVQKHVAPHLPHLAPDLTESFVREALHRSINGVGPFPPAAAAADKQLDEQDGDVERAVHEVVENHVRYAGTQGLITGLGGALTAVVTIPANIAGLALVQTRMVAGIAHLRGYDLDDPRVRNAILACLLREDVVDSLIRRKLLPAPPMAIATAPVHDPQLDRVLSAEVASDLITQAGGKRLAITIARRVPLVGGVFGMGIDGYDTWLIGRYAGRELLPRTRR